MVVSTKAMGVEVDEEVQVPAIYVEISGGIFLALRLMATARSETCGIAEVQFKVELLSCDRAVCDKHQVTFETNDP